MSLSRAVVRWAGASTAPMVAVARRAGGGVWGRVRAMSSNATTSVPADRSVFVLAAGDSIPAANRRAWVAQEVLESKLATILAKHGYRMVRAHPFDADKGHGFVDSIHAGARAFSFIPPYSRVVLACSAPQLPQHVLPGLVLHKGPILTVSNFESGDSGVLGMLGLHAGLTKCGVAYSSLCADSFNDVLFFTRLAHWLNTGAVSSSSSSSDRRFELSSVSAPLFAQAARLATEIKHSKLLVAVADQGCAGDAASTVDPLALARAGIVKTRVSSSTLFAEMARVTDAEAHAVFEWLVAHGLTLHMTALTPQPPKTQLALSQVLQQCRLYIAAVRVAATRGLDALAIHYHDGLRELCPAPHLATALLSSTHRPPVFDEATGAVELLAGKALPHVEEGDEGSLVDGALTQCVWHSLSLPPITAGLSLHGGAALPAPAAQDAGGAAPGEFVWSLQTSGALPPAMLGGWTGAQGFLPDPVQYPLGGATVQGVAQPGEIVWSRLYQKNTAVHADIGRGTVVSLTAAEIGRRLAAALPNAPIMPAQLHGVTRDAMLARHPSPALQVAYAVDEHSADEALAVKAALFHLLGFHVRLCGRVNL